MDRIIGNIYNHEIILEYNWIGIDLHISLYGGEMPHIGSVSVAVPFKNEKGWSASVSDITVCGHKDSIIGNKLALNLCKLIHTVVAVNCGIHFDNADQQMIENIVKCVEGLENELIRLLKNKEI